MFEILAIVAFNILLYFKTIRFSLIADDVEHYRHIKAKDSIFCFPWYKQIPLRLYGGGTLGTNIPLDHALSIFIHTLICVLMYFALGKNNVSFAAALLYSCNPANNQTAIWLNGRRYAVNIVLTLVIMLIGWHGLLLFPLTALFQVNAFFVPFLFGWKGIIAMAAFAVIGWKEIRDRIDQRKAIMFSKDTKSFHAKKLIVIIKNYGAYLLKMIFPGRTMMVYSHLYYWGLTEEGNKKAYALDEKFWFGIACLILSAVGLWYFKPQPQLFWMFLVMSLSVMQWCGFISVTQMFADRYISLANVFMMYFLVNLAQQFLGAYAFTAMACLGVYYIVNLNITMKMYENQESFWDYHFFFNPADLKCREDKIHNLLRLKDVLGAWEIVKDALKHNPNDMKMNMYAARCMEAMEERQSVLHYFRIAKKNCYIGHEEIIKKFEKTMFGLDLDEEMASIQKKESTRPTQHREQIKKLYELVNS